jgi:hypothetical protein
MGLFLTCNLIRQLSLRAVDCASIPDPVVLGERIDQCVEGPGRSRLS